jgi:hypothetical protein
MNDLMKFISAGHINIYYLVLENYFYLILKEIKSLTEENASSENNITMATVS